MSNKTAMQQLIDFIENQEYNFLNKEQIESCNKIMSKAKELLETEKQQMLKFFERGKIEQSKHEDHYSRRSLHSSTPISAEDYYNQTFKQ